MTDSIRKEFEADYVRRIGEASPCVIDYRLLRDSDGRYRQGLVEAEWQRWQAAYLASRRAALEEAAKVCEEMRDPKEAQKAQKNADAAIESGDESEMLHRLRHCNNVSLFNGGLERAARGIRKLADEGMKD